MTGAQIARKVIGDVIESTLGVAYISGGIEAALKTAMQLGVHVGGSVPWPLRPSAIEASSRTSDDVRTSAHDAFEKAIGYRFKNLALLKRALTHRSARDFRQHDDCYEREEFLGDALVEMFATDAIFAKFPNAHAGFITKARQMMIPNSGLTWLGFRVFPFHTLVTVASADLFYAMRAASEEAAKLAPLRFFRDLTWRFDPPKICGDIVEAVTGAIFVDSGCRLDPDSPCWQFCRRMYADVLPHLSFKILRDDVSVTTMRLQARGCATPFFK